MGQAKGIVMDGRDIGTVVFPDAELKIFMTASAQERAKRRYLELSERGDDVSYEEVLANVIERDRIDTTREDSPLVKADDAIEIDNTETNIDDQFHTILQLAKDRIAGRWERWGEKGWNILEITHKKNQLLPLVFSINVFVFILRLMIP